MTANPKSSTYPDGENRLRKLSELEGVSLGIVYRQQPCTAYRVRGELKDAPSSHWRASAGSVYPLLSRLEGERLISTMTDDDDGRGRKLLSITTKGRKALSEWVVAGANQDLISSITDPVRSRTFFLDVLNSAQQRKFLNELIGRMQEYLRETRIHLQGKKEQGNLYDYFGSLGAVKVAEARLDWLRLVRKELERDA